MRDGPSLFQNYLSGDEIALSDRNIRYKIVRGVVLVNIAVNSGDCLGRRLPGQFFEPGSSLFCLDSESFTLMAIAHTDVEIEEIPLLLSPQDTDAAILSFAAWIHSPLFEGMVKHRQVVTRISPEPCTIDSGKRIRLLMDGDAITFCKVDKGIVADTESTMTFSPESGWFPINVNTILDIRETTELNIKSPGSIPEEIRSSGIVPAEREWVLQRVRSRWEDFIDREDDRIHSWISKEAMLCEGMVQRSEVIYESDDPVQVVFDRVLQNIRKDPPMTASGKEKVDTNSATGLYSRIIYLAENAGVRVRRIRLPEKWWNGDHGPLMVFDTKFNLLAAIPTRPGQYRLYDNSGTVWEHPQIPQVPLSQSGFVLYPTFSDKSVTFKDIGSFVYHAIWRNDIHALVLYALIAGLLTTAMPIATGFLFSYAIPDVNISLLNMIILILCMTITASAIFNFALELAMIRIQGYSGKVLEPAVWDRVLKLHPSFFRNFNAGELVSRVGMIDEIQQIFASIITIVIFGVTFSLFNLILIFIIFPDIAWYVLMFTLFIMCTTIFLGWLSFSLRARLLDFEGHLTGVSFQILTGIAKITSSGAENRAYIRWERELRKQIPVKIQIGNYEIFNSVFTTVWPAVLTLLVFMLSVRLLDHPGSIDVGWFLGFFTAVGAFSASFASLNDAFFAFYTILPRWDWMRPILEAYPEVRQGHVPPETITGLIELHHISFRYSPDSPLVLDDISLEIHPGEFVAIVGTSGSGKSTLLRILLGFEKPDAGTVLYDRQNLSQLNIREVRKHIGVVLQDGQLMADTILNNISVSRSISQEEILNAARMAGIADDISAMPLGLHTMISEGATNISGGQKQRILIARAIASQPRIIFFDEATSSLDNITQKIVSQSLQQLHLTRVIIAHRLSTIEKADRIYVLDKGKIVERGKFTELLEKGDTFSRIARRQMA